MHLWYDIRQRIEIPGGINMNWIQSVVMGFFSGLAEPMPLSAEAHRGLLSRLMG